jgi:L-lactate dehydrogenase
LSKPPVRVTIIGLGRVGRTLAFLLSEQSTPCHINLVDPDLNEGSFEDLVHAHAHQPHTLHANDLDNIVHSEVIFHCAGPSVPAGHSRLAVARESVKLTHDIFVPLGLTRSEALVIVLANPVDVVAYWLKKFTGLPHEQVVGTGTMLDTRRFNTLLERHHGLQAGTSQAFLIGEHGSSITLWQTGSQVGGQPLADFLSDESREQLLEQTRAQADFIKKRQGATFYGAASCALQLWRAYRSQTPQRLTISTQVPEPLCQRLGLDEQVFMSLPVFLGQKDLVVDMPKLTPTEADRLADSGKILHQAIKNSSQLLNN